MVKQRIATIEGFEHRYMVYCGLMKTMVEIGFCLSGGPMLSNGHCEHFKELKKNSEGEYVVLIHAIPVEERILKSVTKENSNGD